MVPSIAMKHRKLFPALTKTNSTSDCIFCDPSSCPYNCYPYSDYDYLSPPPPPPSPPTFFFQGHHHSPYMIIIVCLLASFFLLVSYCVIISKSCPGWISSRTNRQPQFPANSSDEELLDENRVDHPIWFITTIGLQQSIINSIAVCKYRKGAGLIEGTECSVCLSEFQEDETLRILPKCNHAFHISCVDTWLRSHTNCPLCRAHIVREGISTPAGSGNQNLGNADTVLSTQIENSQNDVDLGNIQVTIEICETRSGAEGVNEIPLADDDRKYKNEVTFTRNEDIHSYSNPDYLDLKDHLQPMRKSFSLDSSTAATIDIVEVDHSPSESEESSINQAECSKKTYSSVAQCLQETPVAIQRSLSCGGRFFS